jgi:prepilin-type N-terminal cleavage/methylation domain-containing protein
MSRSQKGFTIIDIITVLIILGILAVLAVPKYFDMRTKSRETAVKHAIAEMQAAVTQEYVKHLLTTPSATKYDPKSNIDVGDFVGEIKNKDGVVTVKVKDGPAWWNKDIDGNEKSFTLYSDDTPKK